MLRDCVVVLALLAFSGTAGAEGARLSLLGADPHRDVTLRSITKDRVVFLDAGGEERVADVDDLVDLSFPGKILPPPDPGPSDVAVLLRGGDVLHGRLVPGKEEYLSLSSPLVGRLLFSVDDIREVRFLEAWATVVERPVPAKELDRDAFYYRNLDRVDGTFLKVTPREVVAHTRISPSFPIQFEKLLLVRFAEAPEPEPLRERISVLLLADGSRLTARTLTCDGKHVRATTIRGEALEVEIGSLRALYQTGGKFIYLSDLAPAEERIVPWMGEVYAWDRPRYDRSFLDKPLRAGGETYQKGVGVISGTSITWRIEGGGYERFLCRIALDDEAGAEGDVVFEVLVDGESRFRSEPQRALAGGERPRRIPAIAIEGAKQITLRVGYLDDFVMDFADWIEPMLVRGPARRE